ncbi:MAG: NADH:flavin oxidoreductase [Proteobacteria bacterium]|nr:NADH:flavin oxidoreductase [Pseudomonadota bacterium]
MSSRYPRIASFKTPQAFRDHLLRLGLEDLPCDDAPGPELGRPLALGAPLEAPNRFVIQPMEGWDGTDDGRPTELTERRWQNFGRSGAGWIWGGEAVAVRPEGRANPHQLVIDESTVEALAGLRECTLRAAQEAGHPEPVIGLQLTHSGRWSRPDGTSRPRVAYRHPLLDRRVDLARSAGVLKDAEMETLVADFARAAALAAEAGYAFVDVKHCHGYLLHEFLSARDREGAFGGASLEARSRLTRAILQAVRAAAPGLRLGVRLSAFDAPPHAPGPDGRGAPETAEGPCPHGFGTSAADPSEIDLTETIEFARILAAEGVAWLNVTAASPYTVPHLQRPALFPPSDGYEPPEDPVVGVARLLRAARTLKAALPELTIVSSGWSYLQEYLPGVAEACLREGWFDAVGLGRMTLSYPELPADVLAGKPLRRKQICRTFSDCTTAPRNGMVSGCYPLDDFYRERPEYAGLQAIKRGEA